MTVKILSDSACDLPDEIIEELDIEILPIIVMKDDKEYLDKVTIEPKKMYDDMRKGVVYKTAQIPPKVFEEKFEEIAQKGESTIYVAFSSGLSGTYQTAVLVRDSLRDKYPDMDIDIVDSRSASVGFGLLVHKAGMMAKEGKSKEEILNMLDFYVKHIEHIFTVDNLEYLLRGGRISKAEAFVGGLLDIKPILDIPEDGTLRPIEKVRGRKKLLKRMIEIMEERGGHADLKNQIIGINHGDDLEGALRLKEMIEEKFGCKDFIINIIGCAIGAHSGPGTLSVFFLNEKYEE
ncbi:DegV family protein with EDD domain [Keratinibaculum paraultunense]|uniref:DegV family protein with EDD domain n=1 Tax=Keratinibaculum paraultunense TaxID=1278232 RepID=A0A4R3KXS1_9FIRM|nr:DegV family protein [Keratinibaculum paraultunense]QQY80211.1 DegV family protein [Keratinibaculum paraultunense]TCS90722.1 DegV family protein with EDD domain [Keratinibaculum paraultunense]